ncbi:hypothetical protein R1sor_017239 [Riccia sorocarpa]|uniref:Uncharacterized protein n=1 Tax=Riccia sorocarpa TaxID=122646 RepID=A0ABD3I910_9MARC
MKVYIRALPSSFKHSFVLRTVCLRRLLAFEAEKFDILSDVSEDRSEESGDSEPVQLMQKGGKGKKRAMKKVPTATPPARKRAQLRKDSKSGGTEPMSIDSANPTDFCRALWKDDTLDSKTSSKSACATIIEKYRIDFKGKEPLGFLFVVWEHLHVFGNSSLAPHKPNRLNGYMESCHGFHVSPMDEDGKDVLLTEEEEDGWDFFWRSASQDFDRECHVNPDFIDLVGKKFKVWDGNHRVTVWLQVSKEEKYGNSLLHHPRVQCVIVKPPQAALKEMEVAMHNLNITFHATVKYDWIQDAKRTLHVLSTPLSEYKQLLGDKVYGKLEESRKKTTKKGWYSDNMTVAAGAYIISYNEVMAAQKELSIAEQEMEASGTPWTESEKSKRWKEMLVYATRHWNSLIQKYATIVNPSLGPDFMSNVREIQMTLAQQDKGKKEVKNGMLTKSIAAEEEEKFLKYFDSY